MVISVCGGFLVGFGYGKDPPTSVVTNCSIFGCIASPSGYRISVMFKMIAGGCNFVTGIIFILLWRSKRKSVSSGLYSIVEEKKKKDVSLHIFYHQNLENNGFRKT